MDLAKRNDVLLYLQFYIQLNVSSTDFYDHQSHETLCDL